MVSERSGTIFFVGCDRNGGGKCSISVAMGRKASRTVLVQRFGIT